MDPDAVLVGDPDQVVDGVLPVGLRSHRIVIFGIIPSPVPQGLFEAAEPGGEGPLGGDGPADPSGVLA